MISLEVDFANIYYNIFNNTAIIYIGIGLLQYLIVHRPSIMIHRPSMPNTLTVHVRLFFILA